jgi:hypothetical protein
VRGLLVVHWGYNDATVLWGFKLQRMWLALRVTLGPVWD